MRYTHDGKHGPSIRVTSSDAVFILAPVDATESDQLYPIRHYTIKLMSHDFAKNEPYVVCSQQRDSQAVRCARAPSEANDDDDENHK